MDALDPHKSCMTFQHSAYHNIKLCRNKKGKERKTEKEREREKNPCANVYSRTAGIRICMHRFCTCERSKKAVKNHDTQRMNQKTMFLNS